MAIAQNGIFYEIHGHGPGLPVVLVMGLAMDGGGWAKQLPALERRRRVLVVDNRGVGRSKKPKGPYATADMADDVAGVLDDAGVPRAHVVGVSLGGAISQELALRHARRVKSLALISTFARADAGMARTAEEGAHRSSGAGAVAEAMSAIAEGKIVLDPKALMKFLMPLVVTPAFIERERQWLRDMFDRALSNGFSSEGIAGQVAAALAHDTTDRLATVGAPTLVVLGTEDVLVPAGLTRRLAQLIPGARLVEISDAPHGLIMEHADTVNPLLAEWLASHD
ncbi:MAG TPA: alpha/beta fold hydrolase [Haliangiales bacterium]|nr:alpha/beta fold hydrolase [Haliangiales bacterium]